MLPKEETDKTRFRVIRDGEVHILGHIMVSGVRYSHAIVIEASMYLYRQLTRNKLISTPEGAGEILEFSSALEAVFSTGQNWIYFDGRLAMVLVGREQSISHTVKAPG